MGCPMRCVIPAYSVLRGHYAPICVGPCSCTCSADMAYADMAYIAGAQYKRGGVHTRGLLSGTPPTPLLSPF
eukprot:409592-Rhodomonas_salina.1